MTFRPIGNNEWLVETTTKIQSEIYQSLNELDGIEVSVKKHNELNSIEGSVVLPQILNRDGLPDENILKESLSKRYPNIQKIEVYLIPNKKNPDRQLRIAKIKFEGQTLPKDIKIKGQRRELRPYVPKPLQCKSCSKYGHSHKKCRNEEICAFCGSSNHSTKWNCEEPKCANCGQNHHARSKECVFYIYNTELKLLISRTNITVKEAKLELKLRGMNDPEKVSMYKTVVKGKISPKVGEIYTSHSLGSPATSKHQKTVNSDNSDSVKGKPITVKNTFDILSSNENLEDLDISEQEMQIESHPNRGLKRSQINLSPPQKKSSTGKTEKESSVRPKKSKVQKQESEVKKVENTEISPSPIIITTIKNPLVNKTRSHDIECDCLECLEKDIQKHTENNHSESCGCHTCFFREYHQIKSLTKESLINKIRFFISNKQNPNGTNLECHKSECMCVDHLKYYRKNGIKIVDNLLNGQIENESEYNSPNMKNPNEITQGKNKITKSHSFNESSLNTSSYSKLSSKASSSVNLQNLTTLT